MSNAARAYARKAAPTATTTTEAPVTPNNKPSIWAKIKTAAKTVGRTVAKPFTFIGRKVSTTTKTVGAKIASVAKTVGRKVTSAAKTVSTKVAPVVNTIVRFFRNHWGKIFSAAAVAALFFIAPLGVAIGSTFVTSGIILMSDGNWFSRLIGQIFTEIGIRVVLESVIGALVRR